MGITFSSLRAAPRSLLWQQSAGPGAGREVGTSRGSHGSPVPKGALEGLGGAGSAGVPPRQGWVFPAALHPRPLPATTPSASPLPGLCSKWNKNGWGEQMLLSEHTIPARTKPLGFVSCLATGTRKDLPWQGQPSRTGRSRDFPREGWDEMEPMTTRVNPPWWGAPNVVPHSAGVEVQEHQVRQVCLSPRCVCAGNQNSLERLESTFKGHLVQARRRRLKK